MLLSSNACARHKLQDSAHHHHHCIHTQTSRHSYHDTFSRNALFLNNLRNGSTAFYQRHRQERGANMSFSRSLRASTRLTPTTYFVRPATKFILPLTRHQHPFQAPKRAFTCTPRLKMPQTNNQDLVLSNLFDVKGKVRRRQLSMGLLLQQLANVLSCAAKFMVDSKYRLPSSLAVAVVSA